MVTKVMEWKTKKLLFFTHSNIPHEPELPLFIQFGTTPVLYRVVLSAPVYDCNIDKREDVMYGRVSGWLAYVERDES